MGSGGGPAFSASPGFLSPQAVQASKGGQPSSGFYGNNQNFSGSPYFDYFNQPSVNNFLSPQYKQMPEYSLPSGNFNTGAFGSGFLPGPGSNNPGINRNNAFGDMYYGNNPSQNPYDLPVFDYASQPGSNQFFPNSPWAPSWTVQGFQPAGQTVPSGYNPNLGEILSTPQAPAVHPFLGDFHGGEGGNLGIFGGMFDSMFRQLDPEGHSLYWAGGVGNVNPDYKGTFNQTMPRNYSDNPLDFLATETRGRFDSPVGYFEEGYSDSPYWLGSDAAGVGYRLPKYFSQSLGQYAGWDFDPDDSGGFFGSGVISRPGYGTVDFRGSLPQDDLEELYRAMDFSLQNPLSEGWFSNQEQGPRQGFVDYYENLPSPSYRYDSETGSVVADPGRIVHYGDSYNPGDMGRGSLSDLLGSPLGGEGSVDRGAYSYAPTKLSDFDTYKEGIWGDRIRQLSVTEDFISDYSEVFPELNQMFLTGPRYNRILGVQDDLGSDRFFEGQLSDDGWNVKSLSGYAYNPIALAEGGNSFIAPFGEIERIKSIMPDLYSEYEGEGPDSLMMMSWDDIDGFYQQLPDSEKLKLLDRQIPSLSRESAKRFTSSVDYFADDDYADGVGVIDKIDGVLALASNIPAYSGNSTIVRNWHQNFENNFSDIAREVASKIIHSGARPDLSDEQIEDQIEQVSGSAVSFSQFIKSRVPLWSDSDRNTRLRQLTLASMPAEDHLLITDYFGGDRGPSSSGSFGSPLTLSNSSSLDRNDINSKWGLDPLGTPDDHNFGFKNSLMARQVSTLANGGIMPGARNEGSINPEHAAGTNKFTREMRNLLYTMARDNPGINPVNELGYMDEDTLEDIFENYSGWDEYLETLPALVSPDLDFDRLLSEESGFRATDDDGNYVSNPLDEFEVDVVPYVAGLPEHDNWTSVSDSYDPEWQGNTSGNFAVVRQFYHSKADEWLPVEKADEFKQTFDSKFRESMSDVGDMSSVSEFNPNRPGVYSGISDPLSSSLVDSGYGDGRDYAPQFYDGDALSSLVSPRVDRYGRPADYFSPVDYASFSDPFSFYVDNSYGMGMSSGGMVNPEPDLKNKLRSGVDSGELDVMGLLDQEGYDSFESAVSSMIEEGIPYASKVVPSGADSVPGGTLDNIPAVVDGKSPVRLSTGEYVVPADVVKGIGGGSTESGAAALMKMVDEIRLSRGGRRVPDKFN
jgi:hypothetical protein